MNTKSKSKSIILGGLMAGFLFGSAVPAHADWDWWHNWWGHERRDEVRHDRREIQNGKEELRGDRRELQQDRQELRRDLHNGASRGEIEQDRRELANDREELRRDQLDLRHGQREFHRDHR
jgi:hypothetical protein